MLQRWIRGETQGLLFSFVSEWRRAVRERNVEDICRKAEYLRSRHRFDVRKLMDAVYGFGIGLVCRTSLSAWQKVVILGNFEKQSRRLRTHGREIVSQEISKAGVKVLIYYAKSVLLAWRVVALNIRTAVSLGVDASGNELSHNNTILSDLENEVKLLEGYLNARNGSSRGSSRQSPIDQREFRHTRDFLATV